MAGGAVSARGAAHQETRRARALRARKFAWLLVGPRPTSAAPAAPRSALCRSVAIDLRQMLGDEGLLQPLQPVQDVLY